MKKVEHIKITKNMKVNDLILAMGKAGVMQAGKLALAVDILEEAIKDKECKLFFGLAGAMVPGGMKQIILDMIEEKWIDVMVTTGANLTHDLGESLGYSHYQGNENMDDAELRKQGYNRIYNSLMPNDIYIGLEKFIKENFNELSKAKNIREFLNILGKLSPKNTIVNSCYRNNIPLFCPALADSGIGLMIWGQIAQGKTTNVNAFDDLKEILDIAWISKKSAVFYLGGGVPKNYIQQAMQLAPQKALYGVQITMDREESGGSSGAKLKEGISWDKMNEKAKFVDVQVDSTIALPLITAALKDRFKY
ncbi:MAG: deoxyhypusine synthase family protein [Nanoarchaeota archaeon]